MVSVCFYFQVHQPTRLRKYSVFEIGSGSNYYDDAKNKAIIEKVARKCYLPTNKLMLDLIHRTDGRFKIAYSITGVALEQFESFAPKVIDSFQELASTGNVEFLGETYHHSLSFLYSKEEFREQLALHRKKIQGLFHQTPKVFRNTELIYNNELAHYIEGLGYKGILAEGADHILGWRSPNFVYSPATTKSIKLLLKNYRLSDDIAFRFSDKGWKEWPLNVEKYSNWVNAVNGNGHVVNLFMDYETFGEHQWEDTGIFNFMSHLPFELLKHPDNNFKTPSQVVDSYPSVGYLDIHHPVSWADIERDLSAWLGNRMQQSAMHHIFAMENSVKASNDPKVLEDWRKLQTSDHFYYMCTKWFNDGDVHKYFNPYETPYEGFIAFMNIMNDLQQRIKGKNLNTSAPALSQLV
ncbi:MAG: glycoside hydrolase family 57 protein [Candidatus Woesearchaeota archaeon]